jgi:hypothetical protein
MTVQYLKKRAEVVGWKICVVDENRSLVTDASPQNCDCGSHGDERILTFRSPIVNQDNRPLTPIELDHLSGLL